MVKKFFIHIVCLFGLSVSTIFAQSDFDYVGLKFDAQPKHQSELGISVGNFMVVGDILPQASWGAGLHFRRSIDYAFAWRIDALFGVAKGLEPRNSGGSTTSAAAANYVLNGSLNNGINYSANDWYHNYQTKFMSLTLQGVWSLNSFNFEKQTRKTNIYLLGGVGINSYKAYYDAKNSDGIQHDFDQVGNNLDTEGSRSDRNTAKYRINRILDGDYETRAEIASGRRNNNNPEAFHINFHGNAGIGISFKVNDKFNISIEQQFTFVFGTEGDLLDGNRWRTSTSLTQNNDVVSYTSIRFNFNIGKKQNQSEPLWWVSPLSLMAEELAEVKARPVFDTTDNDNDGVVDVFDEELDTPEGFPVDTHGVQLDSDGDGVADGNDKEPYSPPGYSVDAEGIAQAPAPDYANVDDINRIVDSKLSEYSRTSDAGSIWVVPIVHFNLDRFDANASNQNELQKLVKVIKENPDRYIVAIGHTASIDAVHSKKIAGSVIDHLVKEYGISEDRFILKMNIDEDSISEFETINPSIGIVELLVVSHGTGNLENPPIAVLPADTTVVVGNEMVNQTWLLGYDSIPNLTLDEVYTFKLEIRSEDTGFTEEEKNSKAFYEEIEVLKGEIMEIEFVSLDTDVIKIKPIPDGSNAKKEFKSATETSKVLMWNVFPQKPDNHSVQLNISSVSSDDVLHNKTLEVEVSRKIPLWVWILAPTIILVGIGLFLFFFFYRRREKEKVFPQTAIVFLEEVKHIIGDGDTDTAIHKLLQYFEEQEKLHDELLLLRGQYQNLKSKQRTGDFQPADEITLNRINNAIIQLINDSKNKLALN